MTGLRATAVALVMVAVNHWPGVARANEFGLPERIERGLRIIKLYGGQELERAFQHFMVETPETMPEITTRLRMYALSHRRRTKRALRRQLQRIGGMEDIQAVTLLRDKKFELRFEGANANGLKRSLRFAVQSQDPVHLLPARTGQARNQARLARVRPPQTAGRAVSTVSSLPGGHGQLPGEYVFGLHIVGSVGESVQLCSGHSPA